MSLIFSRPILTSFNLILKRINYPLLLFNARLRCLFEYFTNIGFISFWSSHLRVSAGTIIIGELVFVRKVFFFTGVEVSTGFDLTPKYLLPLLSLERFVIYIVINVLTGAIINALGGVRILYHLNFGSWLKIKSTTIILAATFGIILWFDIITIRISFIIGIMLVKIIQQVLHHFSFFIRNFLPLFSFFPRFLVFLFKHFISFDCA